MQSSFSFSDSTNHGQCNTVVFTIEKNLHKWTCTVQTHVVQGLTMCVCVCVYTHTHIYEIFINKYYMTSTLKPMGHVLGELKKP